MSEFSPRLAKLNGLRNEQQWRDSNRFDITLARSKEYFRKLRNQLLRRDGMIVNAVMIRAQELTNLDDHALELTLQKCRTHLRLYGLNAKSITESFALIREVSGRRLGMRHHHTQIRASLTLLRGGIAEMATGEGKTLAATLAAATAALAGFPVHVVTVNDYLAERDAEEMLPLYEALGITVGIVTHDKKPDQRKHAYGCHICYCSNKELTFDYLKDLLVLGHRRGVRPLQAALLTGDSEWHSKLLLRGLHFAIVDEADSVFIDEARTPLIISGEEKFGSREEELLRKAMDIAAKLTPKTDFTVDPSCAIHLTSRGQKKILNVCSELSGLWRSSFYRDPLVKQALTALHVYKLDSDYIIDDEGAVQIVDPYTGRIMPGRSWGQGLQQMIEIKEGLELSKPRETNAEISYQNFFRKYYHLSGMTGTGREVASELLDVYRLRSENIPLLKPSQRRQRYREVYATQDQKWRRVAALTRELINKGQAILIGTNSVSASEAISQVLREKKIEHRVLNARQDKEEADVVSQAGKCGAVTVATSMAGRGTDIKLSTEAKVAGGLHVIITELQDSARIDRQLAGRSARQGDPGSVSQILSLEDPLIKKMAGRGLTKFIERVVARKFPLPHSLGYRIQIFCQKKWQKATIANVSNSLN